MQIYQKYVLHIYDDNMSFINTSNALAWKHNPLKKYVAKRQLQDINSRGTTKPYNDPEYTWTLPNYP